VFWSTKRVFYIPWKHPLKTQAKNIHWLTLPQTETDRASHPQGYLSSHCPPLADHFYQDVSHASVSDVIQVTSGNGAIDHLVRVAVICLWMNGFIVHCDNWFPFCWGHRLESF
jgi:hypothetical protein